MNFLKTAAALVLLSMSALAIAAPVNINTADAKTISEELTGIGLSRPKQLSNIVKSTALSRVLMIYHW